MDDTELRLVGSTHPSGFLDSAVDINAGDLMPICAAEKDNKITIVCGLNECDGALS